MNPLMNEIKLSELVRLYPMFKADDPAFDFSVAKLDYDGEIEIFRYPCRFQGYLAITCLEGQFEISLNLNTYVIRKNMIFFCEPGNIVQFHTSKEASTRRVSFYIAAISDNLIHEVMRDTSRLYIDSIAVHEAPCLVLPEREFGMLVRYSELLDGLVAAWSSDMKGALHSLVCSLIFFLRSIWAEMRKEQELNAPAHSARAQATVDKFIRLVTEHHMSEHYLAFYAKKLGITPKYLSKLVRDVTGHSAPEWIDSFLVLEAKNMLKYSNMAIKEIVYKMQFPDQSSFYKFFKLHTGMIPSEYRKS